MKTALIVTDMQKGFINQLTSFLPNKIKDLINKKLFDYVIFTKFINYADSPYEKLIGYKGMKNNEETEIVDELKDEANIIFEKRTYSPFTAELEAFLKEKNIEKLFFVGVDTNACVLAGAMNAFDKRFIPFVLADYCASHSGLFLHKEALDNLRVLIGKNQVIIGRVKVLPS